MSVLPYPEFHDYEVPTHMWKRGCGRMVRPAPSAANGSALALIVAFVIVIATLLMA